MHFEPCGRRIKQPITLTIVNRTASFFRQLYADAKCCDDISMRAESAVVTRQPAEDRGMKQLHRKPRSCGRRGQAAIFVTLSLPVTFGVLGFVVDIGWSYFRKEAVYTAAQSAAMAAALDASANVANGCGAGNQQPALPKQHRLPRDSACRQAIGSWLPLCQAERLRQRRKPQHTKRLHGGRHHRVSGNRSCVAFILGHRHRL